jgi:hypothetical protein
LGRGFDLIGRNISTKIEIYSYFTVISSRTIPARGQVVVKEDDMTIAWRIRMKRSGTSLLASTVFIVLSLVCCGQNNNNHLKSNNKLINSDIGNGNRSANPRPQAQNPQIVADEVLVKFTSDTRPDAINRIQAQLRRFANFAAPTCF